jgi:hypothetical protein
MQIEILRVLRTSSNHINQGGKINEEDNRSIEDFVQVAGYDL